jgi:NodT family efflux transporter outer membrane factor (OMF) lipoprotein
MRRAPANTLWLRALPVAGVVALMATGCLLKAPPGPSDLRDTTLAHARQPQQWSSAAVDGVVSPGWLASFGDTTLEVLVVEALEHNADLRIAAARVEQARGYAKAAGASIYPSVSLLARGGSNLSGDSSGLQGLLLSASWELDLWGRVRAGRAAGQAQYASAELDGEYARQSLVAQVAKSWFLATEARLQMRIAEDMVRASEQLVELARQRLQVGVGDDYDLAVAEANLGGLRDTLRQLELGYLQSQRALEVLLGRYPSASLAAADALSGLPPPVPAGLPSELLERRPDVVAAERRVAAAFNREAEAKAARLPTISLTASASNLNSEFFVLQDRDNPVWSAGASLLAPIYRGGALQAQVEIRSAEQKQALAEYARAGLRAFNDVENALASEATLQAREQLLVKAAADNARALDFARQRYHIGAVDLRAVSQQQLALFAAQATLLRVQSEARVQRVNLHLALGGSFVAPPSPPEPVTDGNLRAAVGNSAMESKAVVP